MLLLSVAFSTVAGAEEPAIVSAMVRELTHDPNSPALEFRNVAGKQPPWWTVQLEVLQVLRGAPNLKGQSVITATANSQPEGNGRFVVPRLNEGDLGIWAINQLADGSWAEVRSPHEVDKGIPLPLIKGRHKDYDAMLRRLSSETQLPSARIGASNPPTQTETAGEIILHPPDTSLGGLIRLSVQEFSPPIWFKGSEVIQGAADLPWIPAARAAVIQPGVSYEEIVPFVTESFLNEDFSKADFERAQKALGGQASTSERSVFYAIDVQTKKTRYLIAPGWSLQLLNEPSKDFPPTARLYEMQDGKWRITSTKENSEVLSLPWNDLEKIEAMISSSSAFKDETHGWTAGSR